MTWQDNVIEPNRVISPRYPIIHILKPDISGKVKIRASVIEEHIEHSVQQYYPSSVSVGFIMEDIVRQLYLGIAGGKIDNYIRKGLTNEVHKS